MLHGNFTFFPLGSPLGLTRHRSASYHLAFLGLNIIPNDPSLDRGTIPVEECYYALNTFVDSLLVSFTTVANGACSGVR